MISIKDIKTKEKVLNNIKTFNKATAWTERVKDPIINLNEKTKQINEDLSLTDYGENKIKYYSNRLKDESIYSSKKTIVKSKKYILDKYQKSRLTKKEKDNIIKTKDVITNSVNNVKSDNKLKKVKETKKNVERAKQLAINAKRTTESITKNTIKASKVIFKATVSVVKAMIEGLSSLIGLLTGGGVIAVIVIIVICLIALLCSSVFGIFFANESESITMQEVVRKVNSEMYQKIESEKVMNKADDISISDYKNNWREVIAIYSVKYNNDSENSEPILYLNESNINKLKTIYNDMNEYTITAKMEQDKESYLDSNGNDLEKKVSKKVLEVNINQKSKEEIMKKYNFTEEQINQVNELLSEDYEDLWQNLLYGSSSKGIRLVNIALQEEGYIHGDKYWKWYGFNSRVEWCAVFVSWVANESGVLNDSIPKFAGVENGINWFKERGQWENNDYIPKAGDIIFFDWENDGKPNHVGIVEKYENGVVYTIEGNSTDDGVRKKEYKSNKLIYGYGVYA